MEKVRIQKIIADSGLCSRRKAEELIEKGAVKVNGHPCKLGDKALPGKDIISVNGENITVEKKKRLYYIMLNKPRGYVTTTSDELGRKCVTELLWTKTRKACFYLPTTEALQTTSCTRRGTFQRLTV